MEKDLRIISEEILKEQFSNSLIVKDLENWIGSKTVFDVSTLKIDGSHYVVPSTLYEVAWAISMIYFIPVPTKDDDFLDGF